MSIVATRDSIAESLTTILGATAAVRTHPGPMSLDDVKKYTLAKPASVTVAPIAALPMQAGFDGKVRYGIYCVAVGKNRDAITLALVDLIIASLHGNVAGLQEMSANNLFTGGADDTSTSIWVVTLTVNVSFEVPYTEGDLDPWTLLVNTWQIGEVADPMIEEVAMQEP